MENKLSQLPDLGYEDEPVEQVKVAITTMAFNNKDLIHLLRKRGTAIHNENWDKQRKIENKINDLKNKHLEYFTKPCSVFMSFENEECKERASRFSDLTSDPCAPPEIQNL